MEKPLSLNDAIEKTVTSLRVAGKDHFDATEITRLLGCEPSWTRVRGKDRINPEFSGLWGLESKLPKSAQKDQITDLLDRTTDDLKIWADLTRRYHVDIYCIMYKDEKYNAGFILYPDLINRLAERNIELGFDLY